MQHSDSIEELLLLSEQRRLYGVWDISDEVYFNPTCPGITRSNLEMILTNPARYISDLRVRPNRDMKFGTAVHTAILEPDKFATNYVRDEKHDMRTTKGKLMKAEFEEQNKGKEILTDVEMQMIDGIRNGVHKHAGLHEALDGSLKEHTVFWLDQTTNILCKAKMDILTLGLSKSIDLKTTRDSSPKGFGHDVMDYNLYMQAAFYSDGIFATTSIFPTFLFAAIEKSEPYPVQLYELPTDLLDLGRKRYLRGLETYKYLCETNTWFEPNSIVIPNALKSLMEVGV